MKLGRIFANAVARRVAYVVVAAALAWLGIGNARAAVCGVPTQAEVALSTGSATTYATREAAYNACRAAIGQTIVNTQNSNVISTITACERNGSANHHRLTATSSGTRHTAQCGTTTQGAGSPGTVGTVSTGWGWSSECAAGQVFNSYNNQCQQPCTGRPSSVQRFLPLSGSKQCFNGCVVSYMQNGDDDTSTRSYSGAMCGNDQFKNECGAGYFWNSYMGVCQPIQPDCPQGQVREGSVCKPENSCPSGMVLVPANTPGAIAQGALHCKPSENECPAGNIKSPSGQCLPGDGQCAAGEARRKDGTCGRDSNNDGTADDDDEDPENDSDKDTFAGGDSCTAPPSCNGSPIMCGQARIQWRIDCNTRKNHNVSGGSCTQVPLCTGEKCSAMEYASLLQQWRTTCAVEKIAKGTGDSNGQPEWTKVTGNGTEGAGEEPEAPVRRISLGLGMLDSSGFLGGGSCPTFGTVDLGNFGSVDLDQYDWICQFLAAVRIVMIGIGGFIAFGIVAGRGVV